jgi:hypothetical protein
MRALGTGISGLGLASQTGNPTLYRNGIVWDETRVRLLIPPIHDLTSIAGEE